MVAIAAPATSSRGAPSKPKMRIGSKMILITAPVRLQIIGAIIFPVDCRIFSKTTCIFKKNEPMQTICI
jgi:hypothetical protein